MTVGKTPPSNTRTGALTGSDAFAAYLAVEPTATRILQYQADWIPGLLQTREYATKVLAGFHPVERVPALVEQRLARQRILGQVPATFIVAPSVLADVDAKQLTHLDGVLVAEGTESFLLTETSNGWVVFVEAAEDLFTDATDEWLARWRQLEEVARPWTEVEAVAMYGE